MADAADHDELRVLIAETTAHVRYLEQIGDLFASAGPPEDASPSSAQAPSVPAQSALSSGSVLFAAMEPAVPAATAPQASGSETLAAIEADLGDCTRCRLCEARTHIVFGEGDPGARLMFIGEGPGADEDTTGRPFVGAAGKLLDRIIEAIGLKREQVYIANVVKCRPPGNRKPEHDESATCEPFLFRQIAAINPSVIVLLGNTPVESLLGLRGGITRLRGEFREFNGIKVMPTFHPAYLLRDPARKREVWEDMKRVREALAP